MTPDTFRIVSLSLEHKWMHKSVLATKLREASNYQSVTKARRTSLVLVDDIVDHRNELIGGQLAEKIIWKQ